MRQGVLERIFGNREEAGYVEKFRGLQGSKGATKFNFVQLCNGPEQWQWNILPHHGSALKHSLLRGWQAVDTRRQDGFYGRRNLDCLWIPLKAIGAALPTDGSGLDKNSDALLDEERITFGMGDQKSLEGEKLCIAAHQCRKHRVCAFVRQRVQANLLVVALAPPAVPVLRTITNHEQNAVAG